tara:strand:+ start:972 stop:1409 length:438 start_codon:yes stop_codon:yes gene_type:complete
VLRLHEQRYISAWSTASDLTTPEGKIIRPSAGDSAFTPEASTQIIVDLLRRGMVAMTANIAVHEPGSNGAALRIDFLCTPASDTSVLAVILCSRNEARQKCRAHARRVLKALRKVVPRGVRVRGSIVLLEEDAESGRLAVEAGVG